MFGLLKKKYSKFGEEALIQQYITEVRSPNPFIVDIGAADGIKMSNTFRLFKQGHPGVVIEANPGKYARLQRNYRKFASVDTIHEKVTPDNVIGLLTSHSVPDNFLLLSLDIDGFDFFVLSALLDEFKPAIIVTEINESIPPPLKFRVRYDENFTWNGGHFFGYSISCLEEILTKFNYSLVWLEYNNAFLISNRYRQGPGLSIKEAYNRGYTNKPDRQRKFPYNREMDLLLDKAPQEIMTFLQNKFRQHKDKYELQV